MIGKKFGIIVATLAMFGILLSPTGVQAHLAEDTDVVAEPKSVSWGDSTVIRWNATISSGGPLYYNGTVYVNITDPGGTRHDYTSSFVLSDLLTDAWYNFTFDPGAVSGTWRINTHCSPEVIGENTTWMQDRYNTFSVETQGTSMGRMINDMTGTMALILIVSVLFIMLVVILDRAGIDKGKKGKKT